jgi:hypothetical protein
MEDDDGLAATTIAMMRITTNIPPNKNKKPNESQQSQSVSRLQPSPTFNPSSFISADED